MKKIKRQARLRTTQQKCHKFYRKILAKHSQIISHYVQELETFSEKKIIVSLEQPDSNPFFVRICAILSQPCSQANSFFLLVQRYVRKFVIKFMRLCKKWFKMANKLPMQTYMNMIEDMTLAILDPRWKYREQTLKNKIHLDINDYMMISSPLSSCESELADLREIGPLLSVEEKINEGEFEIYSNID